MSSTSRKLKPALLAELAVILLAAFSVSTSHGESVESEPASAHENAHDVHKNWAALFIGVTSEERRNGKPALGLEYARHLRPSFAIGALWNIRSAITISGF